MVYLLYIPIFAKLGRPVEQFPIIPLQHLDLFARGHLVRQLVEERNRLVGQGLEGSFPLAGFRSTGLPQPFVIKADLVEISAVDSFRRMCTEEVPVAGRDQEEEQDGCCCGSQGRPSERLVFTAPLRGSGIPFRQETILVSLRQFIDVKLVFHLLPIF